MILWLALDWYLTWRPSFSVFLTGEWVFLGWIAHTAGIAWESNDKDGNAGDDDIDDCHGLGHADDNDHDDYDGDDHDVSLLDQLNLAWR